MFKPQIPQILCLCTAMLLAPQMAGAREEPLDLPSGFLTTLQESFVDDLQDGTQVLRLRFVTPNVGKEGAGYPAVADDFPVLCQAIGLPHLRATGQQVDQIVVSISDRQTEFGVANPESTQYFEVFTLENNTCIWESF